MNYDTNNEEQDILQKILKEKMSFNRHKLICNNKDDDKKTQSSLPS